MVNFRRELVYIALDGERDYQDRLNSHAMSPGEELLLLGEYVDRARQQWSDNFNEQPDADYMHSIRKITAIGLRCMENNGTPKRKI